MWQSIFLALMALSYQASVSGDINSAFEKAFRASYRSRSIERCEQKILAGNPRDTNAHDFCVCVTDKILASSTLVQLSQETPLSQSKAFGAECFREHPSPDLTPVIWRTARQLMSVSQVQALFPLARAPDHPKEIAGLREGLVLSDNLEGKPAEVGFFFSDIGLAMVNVGSNGRHVDRVYVERVVAGLTAKFGAPSYVADNRSPVPGPVWTQSTRKWISGPMQITLFAMPSIKPINIGREPSEHAVVVFYSNSVLAN
jgi:hypothetical protein